MVRKMMHFCCQFQHGKRTYWSSFFNKNRNKCVFLVHKSNRLPFDWRNPIGYLCASSLQYMISLCMFHIIASLLSIGVGSFLYAMRSVMIIICNLETTHESLQSENDRSSHLKYLSDFIQFHAEVKELSKFWWSFCFQTNGDKVIPFRISLFQFTSHLFGCISTDFYAHLLVEYWNDLWLITHVSNANGWYFVVPLFLHKILDEIPNFPNLNFSHSTNTTVFWRQHSKRSMHLDWCLFRVCI